MAKKSLNAIAKSKGGRPPGLAGVTKRNIRLVQQLFQEHGQEALDTMLTIMRDDTADNAVRLKAANDILNRGFGTPVNTQVVEKISSEEAGSPVSQSAISSAKTEDLVALMGALGRYLEHEQATIDVTPPMPDGYPKG